MNDRSSKTVTVLGVGRVGSLIAADLAADPGLRVVAVDRDPRALEASTKGLPVDTRVADLTDAAAVAQAVEDADIVVGAVPGRMGYALLETVIRCRKPLVDISFMPEDPAALDGAAREAGVSAVVDCGVAPGLSNWLVGRSAAELDEVASAEIWVGGLPFRRVPPYEYRSVFSPTDVIEEYTRPCRMKEDGREVEVPALTGIEPVEFDEVGTLEAFNTDGLRSLLYSIPAPTLREKTLRYPGHAEKMLLLRETGFLDETPVELPGGTVVPRQLAESLLFRLWALEPGEEEFTVLRVKVAGVREGKPAGAVWDLFDRTDRASGATSMARTTGFPCAIVVRMLARDVWSRPGVVAPEELGRDAALTEELLRELARRGVNVRRRDV